MSKDEFFAFMPLLIYGLAIGEIIMQWRDYLKEDRRYWPHIITGLALLELAFVNFYYLYDDLELLFETYIKFLTRMLPPLVFLLLVSVFTPEPDRDVKEYFHSKMPVIFSLLAFYVLVQAITHFDNDAITLSRLIAASFCILTAYTRNFNYFWIFIAIRWGLFFWSTYQGPIYD